MAPRYIITTASAPSPHAPYSGANVFGTASCLSPTTAHVRRCRPLSGKLEGPTRSGEINLDAIWWTQPLSKSPAGQRTRAAPWFRLCTLATHEFQCGSTFAQPPSLLSTVPTRSRSHVPTVAPESAARPAGSPRYVESPAR